MDCFLSDSVQDTPAVRLQLRDLFRGPSGFADSLTVKNDYRQTLELAPAAAFAGQWGERCRRAWRVAEEVCLALPVEHWLSRGTFEHAAGCCPVGIDLCW